MQKANNIPQEIVEGDVVGRERGGTICILHPTHTVEGDSEYFVLILARIRCLIDDVKSLALQA